MKRIVVLAALFCLPSVVHADGLRVTSYDMDDSGGTVRLESNTPVGEPWVRVDAKSVRVWFPHIVDVARFDHEREGDQPIKALALRPGASDTAVLRVDLGNARHVKPSDVEITRNGPQVSVQIKVPSKVAPMAAPEVTQPLKHVDPATSSTGKHSALAAAEAPAAAAAAPLAAKASTMTDVSAGKTGLLPGMADMPVDLSKQSPPTLMYLMFASLVLAAILGALQYNNKRKPAAKPQIEVLGARRLGHRQELLIVRALGSDHLLLCTAGRAERVASSPTPTPTAPDSFARGEDSQAGGIGLMSRLSSHSRLRKLLDNVDREAPGNEDEERELPLVPKQHPFGAELFSAARKQAAIHSLPAPRTRQSEAVAGIDRLRKRAAT